MKNILIGICGGIACYKVASLVSKLTNSGYNVNVIMTKHATEFVTPLTFSTLSKNEVITDMFNQTDTSEVKHIALAERADLTVIVPATANILAKVTYGIADDMLSTTILACKNTVVFAPAMNNNMYTNKIVQNNIKTLKNYGYKFIEPQVGNLACGTVAVGKLADNKVIFETIEKELSKWKI